MPGNLVIAAYSGRRFVAAFTVAACLTASVLAVDADKDVYVGGTLSGVQEKAEGRLNTQSD